MDCDNAEYDWDPAVSFSGCTRDHDYGEHGWGHCDEDGCDCDGGWEE